MSVKVLRIITRLNVGGPAIHVCLLTAGLRERGFETILVKGRVSPGEVEMTEAVERYGVSPRELPCLRREVRPLDDLAALRALVQLMRRERPDIVHTHTSKAGVLGRIAARLAGVPAVIHTFHGHVLEGYFHPAARRAIVAAERALAGSTTRLVAVSAATAADLVREGIVPAAKIVHIPLGLPIDPLFSLERGRGRFRLELGIPPGAPLVGIVARLAGVKRHELFLEAAARVRAEVPAARFAIVGGGEREAELRALAGSLGLAGAVHFAGFRKDLEDIFSDLDVTVLSSRSEGLPVAVIESMAAGVPVVAARVGGVPELLGEEDGRDGPPAGLMAPAGDAAALAAGVVRLLRDRSEASRLGRAGRERASRYREGGLLAAVADLYHGLPAPRRPGGRIP